MELFHVAPTDLRPGSVIEPGNFGRILAHYVYGSHGVGDTTGWMMARELMFEMERRRVKPTAPNRMVSCFALPSLEEATRYQANNAPRNVILKVELSEPDAPMHYGFLEQFDGVAGQRFLSAFKQRAEAYWLGQGAGDREVVTGSGLRVLKRIG